MRNAVCNIHFCLSPGPRNIHEAGKKKNTTITSQQTEFAASMREKKTKLRSNENQIRKSNERNIYTHRAQTLHTARALKRLMMYLFTMQNKLLRYSTERNYMSTVAY